jgi:hypothetical protein
VLDELPPAARHVTERYDNNPIEADHGRLKARLRPMRGLKRLRTAAVIVAGHAFVQNLRRGFSELGLDSTRLCAAAAADNRIRQACPGHLIAAQARPRTPGRQQCNSTDRRSLERVGCWERSPAAISVLIIW